MEDIYHTAIPVLAARSYNEAEHLRSTLRLALRQRAINEHQRQRRVEDFLAANRARLEPSPDVNADPETAVVAREDALIVAEFMAELTELEQRVFRCVVDGMGYRAIATAMPREDEREIRTAIRRCEQKRQRFQALYSHGRLCGFRSATIQALIAGETTSAELAERAAAHLEHCRRCRIEHRTSAQALRARFDWQAAVPPAMIGVGRLRALALRARVAAYRHAAMLPSTGGTIRERGAATLLGGGAVAKLAAGAASVVLLTGGAIGAVDALRHRHAPRHRAVPASVHVNAPAELVPSQPLPSSLELGAHPSAPGEVVGQRAHARKRRPRSIRVPAQRKRNPAPEASSTTDFSYLGVPARSVPRATTSRSGAPVTAVASSPEQRGGGPFSP
jgi:DNA-directed RNA polymerase specialized sigma24 family protein